MAAPAAPSVPVEALGDEWEQTSDEVETVFELAAASVVGHTCVYEDTTLESTVQEACGIENCSRFVFATRLGFSPSLAHGTHAIIKPTVVSEAKRAFAETLEERGFEAVDRQRRQQLPTESGDSATLFGYHAQFPTDQATVPIEGWLAIWYDDDFLLAGGAYPRNFDGLDVPVDLGNYRDELLSVLRRIE